MTDPAPRWVGTCTSRWALPTAVVVAVLAAASAIFSLTVSPAGAIAPILALVITPPIVLAFRRVEVVVTDDAVAITYAVPHTKRIPIGDIESVEVVDDLRPMQWGGLGYRGGLLVLKQAAVVLRRGPAILLHLRGGRRLAITIDDAAAGAAAIEALLGS